MDPNTTRARERAYILWQQAGCPDGRSDEFWFAALESIAAEAPGSSAPADVPEPAAKKAATRRRAGAAVSARTAAAVPDKAVTKALTSIKSARSRADILPT